MDNILRARKLMCGRHREKVEGFRFERFEARAKFLPRR